ncbi:MAG: DUF1015 family protein, partial [Planctomycetota bacterium]
MGRRPQCHNVQGHFRGGEREDWDGNVKWNAARRQTVVCGRSSTGVFAMAQVFPFRAIRFDAAAAGAAMPALVAPPYDVIDAARRDKLAAMSPYNVVR